MFFLSFFRCERWGQEPTRIAASRLDTIAEASNKEGNLLITIFAIVVFTAGISVVIAICTLRYKLRVPFSTCAWCCFTTTALIINLRCLDALEVGTQYASTLLVG